MRRKAGAGNRAGNAKSPVQKAKRGEAGQSVVVQAEMGGEARREALRILWQGLVG